MHGHSPQDGKDIPTILTVSPGAGCTFETSCLARQLAGNFKLIYLTTVYGGEPGRDGLPPGEAFGVEPFPTLTARSGLGAAKALASAFFVTLGVLLTRRVDLVVVVGSPHAAPMMLAARLLGRRTTFVESITRVDRLSVTGRLVQRLRLAKTLFVQWPGLHAREPGSRLGTIL